jgi:hypothetical protein
MVDPGDTVSATLKKEFGEEALNSLELSEKEQEKLHKMLTKLFQKGQTVCNFSCDVTPQLTLITRKQFFLLCMPTFEKHG